MEKLLKLYLNREKAVNILLENAKGDRLIILEERKNEILRAIYEIKKIIN